MKTYPSWRYHKELGSKLIQSEAEEQMLGSDWFDTPAKFEEAKGRKGIEELNQKRRYRKPLAQTPEEMK